jgi:quinol monooxygenase YgiN
MFVVTVEFDIDETRVEGFMRAMTAQAENTLNLEPECVQFDVCFAPDQSTRVFLYEVYEDEAAFKAHLESDHFHVFNEEVAPWVLDKRVHTWRKA